MILIITHYALECNIFVIILLLFSSIVDKEGNCFVSKPSPTPLFLLKLALFTEKKKPPK